MKVEGWLFAAGFFFFALSAVIYGVLSDGEAAGTVALAFTAGLAFLVGYYLLFTARRIDRRPEDTVDAEIADGAGELGFYSPHSWWPLAVAICAALAFLGIVFGWWLFIIGAIGGGLAVIGLVFEYYRGEPAH
jgi:cytochrome c oxidase subunit IV